MHNHLALYNKKLRTSTSTNQEKGGKAVPNQKGRVGSAKVHEASKMQQEHAKSECAHRAKKNPVIM